MTHSEFSERIVGMMDTLYRVSYSQLSDCYDRDDAVQECICKAYRKRKQLKDERYMQTWVIRILINECCNIGRKKGREVPYDEYTPRTAPPDADFELHEALVNMNETLRLPLVLHYMEGFSIKECAHILRKPQGTIKTRMRRGRTLLREILSREDYAI